MGRPTRLPLEQIQSILFEVIHPRYYVPAPNDPREAVGEPGNPPSPGPIDWAHLFGNDHPVEMEIGFGKGLFLLTQSLAQPLVNFFGIEIERKYALFTAGKLAKQGSGNVKVACTEALWFLRSCVRMESLSGVHVYFPDPWWKNRHRKRKLFSAEFAGEVTRVLKPGGKLHFVTDVEGYFTETMKMLRELAILKILPVAESRPGEGEYLTNFERKYRQEGRPIWQAILEK